MNYLFFEDMGNPITVEVWPKYKKEPNKTDFCINEEIVIENELPPLLYGSTYEGFKLLNFVYLKVGGEYVRYRHRFIKQFISSEKWIDSLDDQLESIKGDIYETER